MSKQVTIRHDWIDLARGVAMAMVVFGHALIGVTTSLESTQVSRFVVLVIYCIHMPVLFFLAGILSHGLNARPTGAFFKQSLIRFIWPYMLWSSLLLFVHFLMSDHTNSVVANFRPWRIIWHPPAVMWFLYVLFWASVLRRVLPTHPGVLIAGGVLCICLPYVLEMQLGHLRFVGLFLLACAIPSNVVDQWNRSQTWIPAAIIFGVLMWVAWGASGQALEGYPAADWRYLLALFTSPVLMVAGCKAITQRWAGHAIIGFLKALGRHSMAVFVLHIFFTAASRILLMNIGVGDIWALSFASAFVGLVGPLFLAKLAAFAQLGTVLGWQRV